MSMTAEEVLAKAAECVEASWNQPGAPCMAQAIVNQCGPALSGARWYHPTAREALTALRKELDVEDNPSWHQGIFDWNDAEGRTAEEVATALRNAKRHLVAP